jgi:hypothetical protein
MDREKLKRHLDEAEDNIGRGVRLVVEQWNLIAKLERKRWDTADARRVLKLLEESRDLHMAERDRLLRALKDYPEPAPETPAEGASQSDRDRTDDITPRRPRT